MYIGFMSGGSETQKEPPGKLMVPPGKGFWFAAVDPHPVAAE